MMMMMVMMVVVVMMVMVVVVVMMVMMVVVVMMVMIVMLVVSADDDDAGWWGIMPMFGPHRLHHPASSSFACASSSACASLFHTCPTDPPPGPQHLVSVRSRRRAHVDSCPIARSASSSRRCAVVPNRSIHRSIDRSDACSRSLRSNPVTVSVHRIHHHSSPSRMHPDSFS
jgi:hypothetical protein